MTKRNNVNCEMKRKNLLFIYLWTSQRDKYVAIMTRSSHKPFLLNNDERIVCVMFKILHIFLFLFFFLFIFIHIAICPFSLFSILSPYPSLNSFSFSPFSFFYHSHRRTKAVIRWKAFFLHARCVNSQNVESTWIRKCNKINESEHR